MIYKGRCRCGYDAAEEIDSTKELERRVCPNCAGIIGLSPGGKHLPKGPPPCPDCAQRQVYNVKLGRYWCPCETRG